jgi:hypothetical protein
MPLGARAATRGLGADGRMNRIAAGFNEVGLVESDATLDPRCLAARPGRRSVAIHRFYQAISGYASDGAGPHGRKLRRARSRAYGELTPVGTRQLIAATRLAADDVFVDLGSGVGKVVLQVAPAISACAASGLRSTALAMPAPAKRFGAQSRAGCSSPGAASCTTGT